MRILAVDPGFERLGVAILQKDGQKESLVYSSCFKTSPKEEFHARLQKIGGEIERVIKEFKPEALAIESLIFNTNQKTAMRVAETRGVIMYEALRHKLTVSEYTPLQVKVAVASFGRAEKKQVTLMVQRILKLENKKRLDDEYDAIAIGLTHFAHHTGLRKA